MDHDRYLPLIQTELKKLPVYIRDFYLQTNHSITTIYQYLTEFRRFLIGYANQAFRMQKKIKQFKLKRLLSCAVQTLCCTLIFLNILKQTRTR